MKLSNYYIVPKDEIVYNRFKHDEAEVKSVDR